MLFPLLNYFLLNYIEFVRSRSFQSNRKARYGKHIWGWNFLNKNATPVDNVRILIVSSLLRIDRGCFHFRKYLETLERRTKFNDKRFESACAVLDPISSDDQAFGVYVSCGTARSLARSFSCPRTSVSQIDFAINTRGRRFTIAAENLLGKWRTIFYTGLLVFRPVPPALPIQTRSRPRRFQPLPPASSHRAAPRLAARRVC